MIRCSAIHADSKPRCSAARTSAAITSPRCLVMKVPNFMSGYLAANSSSRFGSVNPAKRRARVALERLAKVRMRDRDQAPRAFLQADAAQIRRAELSGHDIHVGARRGHDRIVQRGDYT